MSAVANRVDALFKPHWGEQERNNVELIADFINLVMNTHDFETARQRFASSVYRQHSRGIPDGMEGLLAYLQSLTKRFPEYQYDVKHMYADGDHVTFHSHATIRAKHRGDDSKGFNIIDTWRIEDGRIAEHWDAIQPLGASMRLLALVTGGRTRHVNSVF